MDIQIVSDYVFYRSCSIIHKSNILLLSIGQMEPLGGSGNRTNFKSNAPLSWNANICKVYCFNQISIPLLKSRNNIMFHIISQMEHLGGSGDWSIFKSKIALYWSEQVYQVHYFIVTFCFYSLNYFKTPIIFSSIR